MNIEIDLLKWRTCAQLDATRYDQEENLTLLFGLQQFVGESHRFIDSADVARASTLEPVLDGMDRSSKGLQNLIGLHDEQFVKGIYRVVLRREPDPEGFAHYLDLLRKQQASKINILFRFFRSPESRRFGPMPWWLWWRFLVEQLLALPLIGYCLNWLQLWLRLPRIIRNLQREDSHQYAQLNRVDHIAHYALATVDHFRPTLAGLRTDRQVAAHEATSDELIEKLRKRIRNLERLSDRLAVRDEELRSQIRGLELRVSCQHQLELETALQRCSSDKSSSEFIDAYLYRHGQQFRGAESIIEQRLEVYLPAIEKLPETNLPVLDVGSGRGEWLSLLKKGEIPAVGLERNRVLVEKSLSESLDVTADDLWAALPQFGDESVRAVTAFHVFEHFTFQQQLAFLLQCYRILMPGGLLIMETPNPANLMVGSCTFYLDPTHINPVPSQLAMSMAEFCGFASSDVWFLNAPEVGGEKKAAEPPSDAVGKLISGPRDYGILCYKE